MGSSESPSSWQSQNQEETGCQHHLLTASCLCERCSAQAHMGAEVGCYLPSDRVCRLLCELALLTPLEILPRLSVVPVNRLADTISLKHWIHSKVFFSLPPKQSKQKLWIFYHWLNPSITALPKIMNSTAGFGHTLLSNTFPLVGAVIGFLLIKTGGKKYFKKEVGRNLLLGDSGVGILLAGAWGLCAERGWKKKPASQQMGKAQTQRNLFDYFQKQAQWELQKRTDRFDILREELGIHCLPPWFPCEHQEQLCLPHVWNYFLRGASLIALPNIYFKNQLLLQQSINHPFGSYIKRRKKKWKI